MCLTTQHNTHTFVFDMGVVFSHWPLVFLIAKVLLFLLEGNKSQVWFTLHAYLYYCKVFYSIIWKLPLFDPPECEEEIRLITDDRKTHWAACQELVCLVWSHWTGFNVEIEQSEWVALFLRLTLHTRSNVKQPLQEVSCTTERERERGPERERSTWLGFYVPEWGLSSWTWVHDFLQPVQV